MGYPGIDVHHQLYRRPPCVPRARQQLDEQDDTVTADEPLQPPTANRLLK